MFRMLLACEKEAKNNSKISGKQNNDFIFWLNNQLCRKVVMLHAKERWLLHILVFHFMRNRKMMETQSNKLNFSREWVPGFGT